MAVLRKKKVCLKDMQSLLGSLAFATRIMPMGRIFSRRLYMAIAGLKSPSSHLRVTSDMKEDILVWLQFLQHFNGKMVWQADFILDKELFLFSDAAGSCGFGVIWQDHWCSERWHGSWKQKGFLKNIVLLELFPIVVALELWGASFRNRRILIRTHNKGVMFAINCLSSKSLPVIILLRHVVFKCLSLNIWLKAVHVAGRDNDVADALSRQQMERFFRLFPEPEPTGLHCPPQLWELV